MAIGTAEKRAQFRKLHDEGCFVLPNPWDVGSARYLAQAGFQALASTSSGYAWSTGRADNHVSCDDVIGHLTPLVAATDLPLNADFEAGFADDPDGVARNVTRAVGTGVAGLSIENSTGSNDRPLYADALAVERIRAARGAIDGIDPAVMLVARCEGFLTGERDLGRTIARLTAFAEAGADCLYAPGISAPEDIAAVVRAVAPKPVNVLIVHPTMTVQALADLGVRRISTGGALARTAWGGLMRAATEIAEQGTFTAFAAAAKGAELNAVVCEAITLSFRGASAPARANPEPRHGTMNMSGFRACISRLRRLLHPGMTVNARCAASTVAARTVAALAKFAAFATLQLHDGDRHADAQRQPHRRTGRLRRRGRPFRKIPGRQRGAARCRSRA